MTIKPSDNSRKLAIYAAQLAQDKKARDLKMLEVGKVSIVADYFLIVSGNSSTQVHTISDYIVESFKKADIQALRVEGYREGWWVILDYGILVVHIFQPEARAFYDLERLWSDAPDVPASEYLESGLAPK